MSAAHGLTRVPDADLKRLLKALHHQALPAPITRAGLIAAAFGHVEEHLDLLVGSDPAQARALVVAVLAERNARRQGQLSLTVSGPATPGTLSQDTREHVRELIARAELAVLLLGVRLPDDRGLLATLQAIAEPRDLNVTLVADAPGALAGHAAPEGWRVYEPRALALSSRAVVVDRTRVLVCSDGLSGHEDETTLHLGTLATDEAVAASLLEELERLTRAGQLVPVG